MDGLPGLERIVAEPEQARALRGGWRRLDRRDRAPTRSRRDHGSGRSERPRPSLDDVFLQATGRRLEGAEEKGGTHDRGGCCWGRAGPCARSGAIPEATIPALFIPLSSWWSTSGRSPKTFPDTTPFLHGPGLRGLPAAGLSLMFAVGPPPPSGPCARDRDRHGLLSTKLLAAPDQAPRRSSSGRLTAEPLGARALMGLDPSCSSPGLALGRATWPAGSSAPSCSSSLAAASFGRRVTPGLRHPWSRLAPRANVQATKHELPPVLSPLLFLTPNFVSLRPPLAGSMGGARPGSTP